MNILINELFKKITRMWKQDIDWICQKKKNLSEQ